MTAENVNLKIIQIMQLDLQTRLVIYGQASCSVLV
ncbi:hypothetical protein PG301_03820 [Parageobacillus sp. G301]|nr:hypothetical protein PG301_03820 [Parageobacillus sp. G301]